MYRLGSVLVLTALTSCSGRSAEPVTLYRNSPIDRTMRIHWATFDATDGQDYNFGNCEMMARILNANVEAGAKAEGKEKDPGLGFWCESGSFKQEGMVPPSFEGQFPSDSTISRSLW